MPEQRCPACGRRFGCGVDSAACWCAEVSVDAAARARLAGEYQECLCPDCLRTAAVVEVDGVRDRLV